MVKRTEGALLKLGPLHGIVSPTDTKETNTLATQLPPFIRLSLYVLYLFNRMTFETAQWLFFCGSIIVALLHGNRRSHGVRLGYFCDVGIGSYETVFKSSVYDVLVCNIRVR